MSNETEIISNPEQVLVPETSTANPEIQELENKSAAPEEGEKYVEAGEAEEGIKQEEEKKKKGGFQKRLDRADRALQEKNRELEYWKQQALRTQVQESGDKSFTRSLTAGQRPVAESFDDHETYLEALADWRVEQKLAERDAKTAETALRAEQAGKQKAIQDQMNSARERYADFDDALEEVEDVRISAAVHETLSSSEIGADLIYALAKNRDELIRISSLTPLAAARELGKLEASLQKTPAQKEQVKLTKAPAPINPVGKGSHATVNKNPDDMSFQEFKRWREKRT